MVTNSDLNQNVCYEVNEPCYRKSTSGM